LRSKSNCWQPPAAAYARAMAKLPGIDNVFGTVVGVLQTQTEALAALPGAVTALTGAVRGLADTVQTLNRMVARVDGIVTELEEPLKALGPGMTRLAALLDDPVVEEIPATLKQVQADILPVLRTLADTHERVAFIAGSTERIMSFVDDTSRTLAGLPGAALLGRRRPAAAKVIVPPEGSTGDTSALPSG
jgi:hypothetical protein